MRPLEPLMISLSTMLLPILDCRWCAGGHALAGTIHLNRRQQRKQRDEYEAKPDFPASPMLTQQVNTVDPTAIQPDPVFMPLFPPLSPVQLHGYSLGDGAIGRGQSAGF